MVTILLDEEKVIAPKLISIDNLSQSISSNQYSLIGSGWSEYAQGIYVDGLTESQLLTESYPNAKYGLVEAKQRFANKQVLLPQELQPTYLRNNVAAKKLVKN